EVVTVEHLAADGRLDPVQEAFIEAGALSVRVLHPRLRADDEANARRDLRPERRRDPPLSVRKLVPLRRLSRDYRRSEARRPQAQGSLISSLHHRHKCWVRKVLSLSQHGAWTSTLMS